MDPENSSANPPLPQHGQGGSLGIDIDSAAPQSTAPATLHLHQVPTNMQSVGQEPPVGPPPTTQPSPPTNNPQEQNSHSDVKHNPAAPDVEFWKDKPKNPEEGVLSQVMSKASEIIVDVKERAGGVLGEALGELKERASGAWQTVAGVVGAVPGKELREDQSEVVVTGSDQAIPPLPGQKLGVDISSYQPPVNSPAGIYLHGEVQTTDKDGQRQTQVVGSETTTKQHIS